MTPLYNEELLEPPHSQICNHQEVCTKCGRVKCIYNMKHTRLYGYVCMCGEQDWKPINTKEQE